MRAASVWGSGGEQEVRDDHVARHDGLALRDDAAALGELPAAVAVRREERAPLVIALAREIEEVRVELDDEMVHALAPEQVARTRERAELGPLEIELQHADRAQLRRLGVFVERDHRHALDRAATGLDRGRAPREDRVALRVDRQLEVERPGVRTERDL